MAEHGGPATMTDYIKHHLHYLEKPVGDGSFWVLHVDSIFFKLALALLFVFLFLSSVNLPRNLIEQDWFRAIATYNPVSYLVEGVRSLISR